MRIEMMGEKIPQYQTKGSAGFDLEVTSIKKLYRDNEEVSIKVIEGSLKDQGFFFLRPFERLLVGTGISLAIPEGKQLEIRDRSGIALKKGLLVANSPGTIDSDYRGEICVILINVTKSLNKVQLGQRIAQGVITNYTKAVFEKVDKFDSTERGNKGFGSTGT